VARTILLLHIISVRSSKQPLMVRTFLKVYMELGSSFLFLQEQIKDIIILCCHGHRPGDGVACCTTQCTLARHAQAHLQVLAKSCL
jgi:hypothetical protein